MEQLRRSRIRSPCDAVLFRWQPVCWFVWKSADRIGCDGAAWKQRRPEVLELVWIRQSCRMVCLFRVMVCRSKWLNRKWKSSEVLIVQFRCYLVSGKEQMAKWWDNPISRNDYFLRLESRWNIRPRRNCRKVRRWTSLHDRREFQ